MRPGSNIRILYPRVMDAAGRDDDDVESQRASVSTGASRGRPVTNDEWVGTTLSPMKVLQWKDRIGTNPVGPRGHYNPHGMLAAQRYVAERFACEQLLEWTDCVIADVGAAPHRTHEHLGLRGRYLLPQVHVGDRGRRGRVPREAAEFICPHRFEDCTCYDAEEVAYLFTHSAYYVDPMVLWLKLSAPNTVDALVVEHYFDDVFGGFYDEADWSVARETVTMTVKGNHGSYIHTLPPWSSGWVGGRGEAFECEVLKTLDGVTRVVRPIPVTRNELINRTLTWGEVETNPNLAGPVQFSQAVSNAVADNAKFTQVTFDVHKVRKFGPVLYTEFLFRGVPVEVTLPVNGVSQVATHCVNKPRTPALFAEVTHIMRTRWRRARIPPGKLAETLTATVALGFVVNLGNEMDLLQTMTSRFTWAMRAHSILLEFGSITVRWWPWILCGAMTTMALAGTASYFEPEPWQQGLTLGGAIGMLLLCWCCGGTVTRLSEAWRNYVEAGWVSSYSNDEGPRAPLLGNGFTLQHNLPLKGSRHVRECPVVVQGMLSLGASNEREIGPTRMLVSGIVEDGTVTNTLEPTQAAELSAVCNRILAPRENPEDAAVKTLNTVLSRQEFKAARGGVDTSQKYLESWLTKLKGSYPVAYIDKMRDAWLQNQGTAPVALATKSFLKLEKSAATVKVDEAKATKPRLIQPPEDVDKAITGPVVWQLWKSIRAAWDGVKTPVMYCSGYSSAAIGDRVDAFIDQHQDVVAWSVDMASYDATLSLPLQQVAFDYYKSLGMPAWVEAWLKRVRSRGVTPNAVSYMPTREYRFDTEQEAEAFAATYRKATLRVLSCGADPFGPQFLVVVEDFQMTSGRMDTNLTDTVVLVASVLAKMPKDRHYLLLACGDDGFLLLKRGEEDIVGVIQEFQQRLGLKPEGVVTSERWRWEFCSKLFWKAIDPTTGATRTVLGAKPFRGIARMGVNTTLPGAANAAAAAQSVKVDAGHVPFLGAFAERTYELCRDQKIRAKGRTEWTNIRSDKTYLMHPWNYVLTQERYGLGEENECEFRKGLRTLNRVPIVHSYTPAMDAVGVDEA